MEKPPEKQSTSGVPADQSNTGDSGCAADLSGSLTGTPVKTLFVGGPKDGKREYLPSNNGYVRAVRFDSPRNDVYPGDLSSAIGITEYTYVLKKFVDPATGKTHTVAFDSKVGDPITALIKGYRSFRNPRVRRRKIKWPNPLKLTGCNYP